MGIKNKIQNFKSFFTEPLFFYYNIFKALNSLQLEDIDENDLNSIIINNYSENLYCVELSGAGENIQILSSNAIDSLVSEFKQKDNAEFTWVLVKNKIYKKNLIFTQNRDLANVFAANLKSKLLSYNEIADVLLSLYFHNEYEINKDIKCLDQKYKLNMDEEYKNPLNVYNNMLRERTLLNYKQSKFYQAVEYVNEKKENQIFDIVDFFKLDFNGALFTKIILNENQMIQELETQKQNTFAQFSTRDKKTIEKLIKDVKAGNRLMINSTLMVQEDYGNNISHSVERDAFCLFDRVTSKERELCNKTPIFNYNNNFSRVISKTFLYGYICSNSKLDSDKADLIGTTVDGSFVNFGFKKATQNNSIPKPHTILLGTSGAGKTVAANEILRQLIDFDVKKSKVNNLKKTNHVIFDIKDSFYNQVNEIHKFYPEMVDMQDFNKNEFLYNIVDCDLVKKGNKYVPVENDLSFSVTMITMILQSGSGNEYLSSSEAEEYKDVLKELYIYNNYDKVSVGYIAQTHKEDYDKIISLGYDDFTLFSDIKEIEFEKFKKPLLHNVLNALRERENKYLLENREMKMQIVQTLIFKLEAIEQMGIFSNFSKLVFDDKPIIYFKTDDLLDSGADEYGYFVFSILSIIAKKAKKEQHRKRIAGIDRPMIYFWFEEARNIFSNKLFKEKEVFERVVNEWRSYDMLFFPITQEPQHIPDTILNGFEIKMLLVSGEDEEEKEALLDNLSKRLSIGENRKKMIASLPKYTMMVMYGDGAFSMKFNIDEKFVKLINT